MSRSTRSKFSIKEIKTPGSTGTPEHFNDSWDEFTENQEGKAQKSDESLSIVMLAETQQWSVIKERLAKNQITSEMIAAQGSEGDNVLVILASDEQWDIIKEIVAKKLVTAEMIAAQGVNGAYLGPTALAWLASERQWDIIDKLLVQDLITPQALAAQRKRDAVVRQSALFWLVEGEQWALISSMLAKGLITSQALIARSQDGLVTGDSALSLLIEMRRLDLLNEMVVKGVVTNELIKESIIEQLKKSSGATQLKDTLPLIQLLVEKEEMFQNKIAHLMKYIVQSNNPQLTIEKKRDITQHFLQEEMKHAKTPDRAIEVMTFCSDSNTPEPIKELFITKGYFSSNVEPWKVFQKSIVEECNSRLPDLIRDQENAKGASSSSKVVKK